MPVMPAQSCQRGDARMSKTHTNEGIRFRLIVCPECKHNLCWVNPRLPTYCPECSKQIYLRLVTQPQDHVLIDDRTATIRHTNG